MAKILARVIEEGKSTERRINEKLRPIVPDVSLKVVKDVVTCINGNVVRRKVPDAIEFPFVVNIQGRAAQVQIIKVE